MGNEYETLTIGDIHLNTKPHHSVSVCLPEEQLYGAVSDDAFLIRPDQSRDRC